MFEYIKLWLSVNVPALRSEKGQDLAEYALLIGLIAIVAIIAVTALGTNINSVLNTIGDKLKNVVN
jgi:pilus assembly protein Flp/PilA